MDYQHTAVPQGFIGLWSGAANAIPTGWVLCNGANGTPDLRDRFVVGAGSGYSVGNTGGSANATLVSHSHTVNNHTHSFSGSSSHSHTVNNHTHYTVQSGTRATGTHNAQAWTLSSSNYIVEEVTSSGYTQYDLKGNALVEANVGKTSNASPGTNSQTVSISGTTGGSAPGTNSQGSSATNANLPPYYALCYIMKT